MTTPTSDPAVVVAAAMWRGGRLLAARRSRPAHLAGGWELPGGKVEPGESPQDALRRELVEELGVHASVGARFPGSWPIDPGRVLHVFHVDLGAAEQPQPLEQHDAVAWVTAAQARTLAWLPADREPVALLLGFPAGALTP